MAKPAARLPATYEDATRALAACSSIDECQERADKAEAMASYAKQAKDETLRKMADRIQARAIRRCGELLRQVKPAVANQHTVPREGDHPEQIGRTQVAIDAGLSDHQRKTALRVAAVPEAEFTQQVESVNPPTVTALAKQGTASKPKPLVELGGIAPADYTNATRAMGVLERFATFCDASNPSAIAAAIIRAVKKNLRRSE